MYPKLSEISKVLGVEIRTETKIDLLFCKITKQRKNKDRVANTTYVQGHVQSYSNVPVTSSEDFYYFFQKSCATVDSFIKINCCNDSE